VQVVVQVPQCAVVFRSTQVPEQSVWPPAHLHTPLTQLNPLAVTQGRSQPPQCAWLELGSMHCSGMPQSLSGSGHPLAQAPPTQLSLAAHGLSQPPQCAALLEVSTQVPPQSLYGALAHWQLPSLQASPLFVSQGCTQSPQ
jgi:hypothetical protein